MSLISAFSTGMIKTPGSTSRITKGTGKNNRDGEFASHNHSSRCQKYLEQ